MAKRKGSLEFRYYNLPAGEYVMSKLGEGWEMTYGVESEDSLHFHNYMEIGYCYWGGGRLIFGEKEHRYGGDMFSILPASLPHVTCSDEGGICKWEFLFVDINEFIRNEMNTDYISPDDIIRIVNKKGLLLMAHGNERLDHIIRGIIEECREKNPYYRESLKGYLTAFVIEILRLDEERLNQTHNLKQISYLETVIDYIHANYDKDIKASDLAMSCGLSESHFRKVFTETMNMSPMEYVNMMRIRYACNLIQKKDMSMEDVGIKVGFQSQSSFNRNFKQIVGMSPYQWKRKAESEGQSILEFNVRAMKGWEF